MKQTEFIKIAGILAKEHKIQVIEGQSWAANIKDRKVFFKKEDIYNLSEDHILGLILHEVAHVHYTSDTDLPKNNQELTKSALNLVEDISIEYIISSDYPNAGEILASTKTELLDILVKALGQMKNTPIHEKALLYAACKFEGRGFQFPTKDYERIGDKIAEVMKKNSTLIYGRKHTKELLPLVKEIVDILIKEAGQPSQEDKWKMQGDMHGHASEHDQQSEAKSKTIKTLKGGRGWKDGAMISSKVKFIDAIADQANAIGKKLRTVLKRNNAMEYAGRFRTGKLMAKRFVRVKVLKDRRPFARRIVKSNQSYAFAIASDVSGSMFSNGGSTNAADFALSSMHMVAESLRMAGVPRSLAVFGDEAKVVAPMGKNAVGWDTIANEQSIKKARPGGTEIHKAIDACRMELEKARAERKILIILTDGSSDFQQMQEAHKRATDAGIECLGITIGGNDGSYMDRIFSPEKNRNIDDASNNALIGQAFVDILKTSIARSP